MPAKQKQKAPPHPAARATIQRERVVRESRLSWWGAGSFERPRAPLGERVSRVLLYA
jgi:hypothetical protein